MSTIQETVTNAVRASNIGTLPPQAAEAVSNVIDALVRREVQCVDTLAEIGARMSLSRQQVLDACREAGLSTQGYPQSAPQSASSSGSRAPGYASNASGYRPSTQSAPRQDNRQDLLTQFESVANQFVDGIRNIAREALR